MVDMVLLDLPALSYLPQGWMWPESSLRCFFLFRGGVVTDRSQLTVKDLEKG